MRQPILLCHPACSGGSLIYKCLVAALDCYGVYEVGHRYVGRERHFRPFDPESHLLADQVDDPALVEELYWNRILSAVDIAAQLRKPLLIREHTHQYFFDARETIYDGGYSWVERQYFDRKKMQVPGIISVRDPIDCWLGMVVSFPDAVVYDFAEYCRRYLAWIDAVEQRRGQGAPIHLLKYEDITVDPQEAVAQVARWLKLEALGKKPFTSITSSGNSGRLSDTIEPRPRRSYTMELVQAARESAAYAEICTRLNYPRLDECPSQQPYPMKLHEISGPGVASAGSPRRWWNYLRLKKGGAVRRAAG